MPIKKLPLCYRCEHRAAFNETKLGPRYECGVVSQSVYSCYMYRPVFPVIIKPDKGEKRDIAAPIAISARCHGIAIADDLELVLTKHRGGYVMLMHRVP
jgi:hypothetical protein